MIAVDTNVLACYLTNDDPTQSAKALRVMRHEDIFIPKTVLLELEWVLRGGYKFERAAICGAMAGVLGLPNITVEDSARVQDALQWYKAGLDFADALHVASCSKARRFATFDDKLVKRAKKLLIVEVVSLGNGR
jgi:predicted nucleic-acid-binding protein